MSAITLAHISDLHLPFAPSLTLRQRFSKRQLSAWSWRRRRHIHQPRVLESLVAQVQAAGVDHIVVTGDLVNFSFPREFRAAAQWLSALAPPTRLSLVPGNHDALVPVAISQGLDCWAPWTRLDGNGWPYVHRVGELALIGVNTAVATAPALARGRVGTSQCARLERLLLENTDACRVVLMHHPLAEGAVTRRKALADREIARAVLARSGAELILHGHARDARLDCVPGPRAAIPCICVPSSSALPNLHDAAARWHHLCISPGEGGWQLEVRVHQWSMAADDFIEAGAYQMSLPVNSPA